MPEQFSHSSLGTFRQCPRQYKFQKIDRVRIPRPLYSHFHLGATVHRQLKTAYEWAADGKLYPLETMLEAFEKEWQGETARKIVLMSEHRTIDDEIALGRKMLTAYHERYQPFTEGTLIGAELNLSFQLPGCPGRFRAIIDRLLRLEEGRYQICDYKTGKIALGSRDPNFRNQMGLYQLAVQDRFPQFEEIEVAQHFLKHGETISYSLRPDELDELAEQFRSEVAQIEYARKTDNWPTHEGNWCNWCDFVALCPAKRHRQLLETEEEDDEPTTAKQAARLADQYLDVYSREKELKAELDALKAELVDAARELGVSKLEGSAGSVSVTVKQEEKLPTKSRDEQGLAELTAMVRGWNSDGLMDGCFKLDDTALLDLYRKGRLTQDQSKGLEPFLMANERVTVRVKLKEPDEVESDE